MDRKITNENHQFAQALSSLTEVERNAHTGLISTVKSIRSDYQVNDAGRIQSPGKFEGEPVFVPWLWQCALDGCSDSDNGKVYGFTFKRDDIALKVWPELKAFLGRKRSVKLRENDSGFVYCY